MRVFSPAVPILALAAALAGCGGKMPPTHYYLLEAENPAASSPAEGLEIGVKPFHVVPPYDQDRIVYRVGDGSPEIGFYDYHRWAAPLSRMLPGLVAAELASTSGVTSAEATAAGKRYDALLWGRVLALEEIDLASGPQVHVEMRLTLTEGDEELWDRTVSATAAAPATSVASVVDAMRATVRSALAEARPDLAAALQDR